MVHFNKEYTPILVRYGTGIVFFLFGLSQITTQENWLAWFPSWIESFGVELTTVILITGIFNLIIGGLLLLGLFTRLAALLGILHLVGVITTIGYNDIAIRDFGLLLALIGVLFYGADKWCLDLKWRRT